MVDKNNFIAVVLLGIQCIFSQVPEEKCGTFVRLRQGLSHKHVGYKVTADLRPDLQASRLTKSGKFRIHFDTTGINQASMLDGVGNKIPNSYLKYVDTLSWILDSVWSSEIEAFQFVKPPADGVRGGGPEYDIYVVEKPQGVYGETFWESDYPVSSGKPNVQYPTYMTIDNDYYQYRTPGVQGLKATCAHEFHHAIQIGGSGIWDSKEFYFYELCAEAMEPTVFPDVKDYIGDVKTFYTHLSTLQLFYNDAANDLPGYERAIWGVYLMRRFGTDVMKDLWDEIKYQRPLPALQNTLYKFSSSTQRAFAEFSRWLFYTGYRADATSYFPDGKEFPMVKYTKEDGVTNVTATFHYVSKNFISNYFKFFTPGDSAFFIVSNTNYDDAVIGSTQVFPFQISVSSSSTSGLLQVSNSIYGTIFVADISNWANQTIGWISPAECFPNPFNPKYAALLISLNGVRTNRDIALSIYSANTMDLVYSNPIERFPFLGVEYAKWNGIDTKGNMISSGVYIYVLSTGSTTVKGKFAVLR